MKKLILYLIKLYKKTISPANFGMDVCKFTPSCADYTFEAVDKYGTLIGLKMGLVRLLRCNPLNKSNGFDPVR